MKTKLMLFLLTALVSIAACKKNGTGGKATIKGIVAHHSQAIPGATVYIKYDALDFPGSDVSKYDSNVSAGGDGSYEIKNLLPGDYYLYGVGFDIANSEPVFGGVPVKIRRSDKKRTLEVNVAVVE
jgi:hypothetical protein